MNEKLKSTRLVTDGRLVLLAESERVDDITAMARELLFHRETRRFPPTTEELSRSYSTQHARHVQAGCEHFQGRCYCDPPHHLRCDHLSEDHSWRCILGSGHGGDHRPPRVKS